MGNNTENYLKDFTKDITILAPKGDTNNNITNIDYATIKQEDKLSLCYPGNSINFDKLREKRLIIGIDTLVNEGNNFSSYNSGYDFFKFIDIYKYLDIDDVWKEFTYDTNEYKIKELKYITYDKLNPNFIEDEDNIRNYLETSGYVLYFWFIDNDYRTDDQKDNGIHDVANIPEITYSDYGPRGDIKINKKTYNTLISEAFDSKLKPYRYKKLGYWPWYDGYDTDVAITEMSWKNEYIMFTFKIDEDKLYETNNPKIILKYTAFGKDFEDKIKSEFYTKN